MKRDEGIALRVHAGPWTSMVHYLDMEDEKRQEASAGLPVHYEVRKGEMKVWGWEGSFSSGLMGEGRGMAALTHGGRGLALEGEAMEGRGSRERSFWERQEDEEERLEEEVRPDSSGR